MIDLVQNDARVRLIERIQDKAKQFESMAIHSAIDAARHPGDKDKLARAANDVYRHDSRQSFANEVIELINANWPRVEIKEPPQ